MAQETGTVYNSIANNTVIRATVDRPNRKVTLIWDAIPGVDYYQLRRDDRILFKFVTVAMLISCRTLALICTLLWALIPLVLPLPR